jgi:amino acid adenylation domain-containing protein/thioester reductase-like protein
VVGFLPLLADQVRKRPEAPAIFLRGELVYSYESLWSRARALASALRDRGVGPESIVGLHLGKSPDFIVGMLACWWNRAAFLSLEPKLPVKRLALMARECQLACVISEARSPDWIDESLLLSPKQAGSSTLPPQPVTHAEDLAYLIYSSGSTGHPKAVEVLHRGLVNVLLAQIDAFALGEDSQLLWLLSPSFDASQSDIGTALLSGAAIHIEDYSPACDPRALLKTMGERGITHLDIPPSLLRLLDRERAPQSLETLVIGGELCSADTVRRWVEICRVVNVYGPTEATICTSMIQCNAHWQRPFIGDPIPGVVYRVLGEERTPVLPGEVGELYIGGEALARGYRAQPELTAERFLSLDGERFFRSGDRVRLHEEGLEFVGRVDRQVKHAGVLVAPEEIEARMLALDSVRECAVQQERVGERSMLVAYCVANSEAAELRESLAKRLPEALIPNKILLCTRLPRLVSGKVDFAQLAAAPGRVPESDAPVGSPVEARLILLWRSVLGVQEIDREADFFALGGDSMAVVELLVAAEDAGLQLSVEQVYRYPRLAALAAALEREPKTVARSCEELELWAVLPTALERKLDRAAGRAAAQGPFALLTGATGFLGAHLLCQLLEQSEGEVYLLIRARSIEEAWRRVDANLESLGLTLDESERSRCRPLLGDLQSERMGLSVEEWRELVNSVGRIYHCAAAVNLLQPLEMLAPTNVLGCQRVVEFMCAGRRKELHYASTLSIFVGSDREKGVLREADDSADVGSLHGGYAQSKWVAERLLRSCGTRAGKISYYRFGLLIGNTEGGRLPQNDWLALYVRGLLSEGVDQASSDYAVDLTPVDYAAAAMMHLSLQDSSSTTFHIANSQAASMAQLHEAVARLKDSSGDRGNREGAAVARLGACRDQGDFERLRPCDLFQATGFRFDCRNTHEGLVGSGIVFPPPAPLLIQAYVEKLALETGR